MYQKFTADELIIDQQNNCVVLTFTYDLDPDTINEKTIYITEAKQKILPMIEMDRIVDGQEVKLIFKEDAKVNTEYEIHATEGIRSIVGDSIAFEYERTFIIKSIVDSAVEILSPVNYEEPRNFIDIKLEEKKGHSKKLFNSYRVQISSDFNFIDILWENMILKQEFSVKEIDEAQQYFMRARSEKDEFHGNWSHPVTFTYQGTQRIKEDDFEPVLEQPFEIIGYPENGTTPSSFIFEFPDEIDPDSFDMKDILVLRKPV